VKLFLKNKLIFFAKKHCEIQVRTILVCTLWCLVHAICVYEKTTCQSYIKFISDDYFQIYKTLQLFTHIITLNTNILTSIKVIKNTSTPICTNTKVIKNAQLIKAWVR
jgi:hypothetical protein